MRCALFRDDALEKQLTHRLQRHVVDEAGAPEPSGGKDASRSIATDEWRQCLGIDHIDIVDLAESGAAELGDTIGDCRSDMVAPLYPLRQLAQHALKRRRHGTLGRRQIDVARRKRQPIGLAHDRHALDPHGDVEVAHNAANHLELLPVLLAEASDIGLRLLKELGHDGSDAGEMAGAEWAALTLGDWARADAGGESLRIDLLEWRRVEQVAAGGGELGGVAALVAWIAGEILIGGELRRVYEQARDNPVAQLARPGDQRQMAAMERAHGRHQRYGLAGPPPRAHAATQLRDAARNRQLADPLRARPFHAA